MYRTYYRVEMTTGSGSMPDNYETYDEAYDALCTGYVEEKKKGYTPTKYKIMRYQESKIGEQTNIMIQPVWS